MDHAKAAELQVLLEGVPLPVRKQALLRYARHEGADVSQLAALQRLPRRLYDRIDEVAEAVVRVQPRERDEPRAPREESGAPPGGADYTNPSPVSGEVRDK